MSGELKLGIGDRLCYLARNFTGKSMRRAMPRFYASLLRLALRLDHLLPACPLGYAVVRER